MAASTRKTKKTKKAQMPAFNWLLTIIIGAVILFLAVYFAGKLIKTGGYKESAVLLRNLDILLNPFTSIGAIGYVESKPIKMPVETIVEFSCDAKGLGKQGLRLKSKGSFGKWSEFTEEFYIYDKYVYATSLKGEKFCLLSKPFVLPFRIDDLIYIISQDYCFVDAPEEIKEELGGELGVLNKSGCRFIQFEDSRLECKEDSKKVCFNVVTGCDINVKGVPCGENEECEGYKYGDVNKDGKILPFVTDALLYAAIFSDSKTYECNFERLMYRLSLLCDIYKERVSKLNGRGCEMKNIDQLVASLQDESERIRPDTSNLYTSAQNLADRNYYLSCPLF